MGVEPINKVGADCQIAAEWMALGEGQDFLFNLLADQAVKIFKAVGASFKRLGAGGINCGGGVLLDLSAQAHDGTQRFGSAQLEGKRWKNPTSVF
jgi:hypothetical protein